MKIHHALIIVAVALLAAAIVSEVVPALKIPMTWASIGSVMFGFLFALFSLFDKTKRKPALVMLITTSIIMIALVKELLPTISGTISTPPTPTPTPSSIQSA